MRRRIKLFNRLRITLNLFIKTKPLTLVQCSMCDSFDLDFMTIMDTKHKYISEYRCKKCGATCQNFEHWKESEVK